MAQKAQEMHDNTLLHDTLPNVPKKTLVFPRELSTPANHVPARGAYMRIPQNASQPAAEFVNQAAMESATMLSGGLMSPGGHAAALVSDRSLAFTVSSPDIGIRNLNRPKTSTTSFKAPRNNLVLPSKQV